MKTTTALVFLSLTVTCMCTSIEAASLFYDLHDTNGIVLARLELSSLPATLTEVEGLTFTTEGEAIIELGPVYLGDFDTQAGLGTGAIDDLAGGLVGDGGHVAWYDTNPPYMDEFGELSEVLVQVGSISGFPDGIFRFDALSQLVDMPGYWRLIPEPSSLSLIGAAVLFGVGLGRRRKRTA